MFPLPKNLCRRLQMDDIFLAKADGRLCEEPYHLHPPTCLNNPVHIEERRTYSCQEQYYSCPPTLMNCAEPLCNLASIEPTPIGPHYRILINNSAIAVASHPFPGHSSCSEYDSEAPAGDLLLKKSDTFLSPMENRVPSCMPTTRREREHHSTEKQNLKAEATLSSRQKQKLENKSCARRFLSFCTDDWNDGFASPAERQNRVFLRKKNMEQWQTRYTEMLTFHALHGHFNIPHGDANYTKLIQWIKRQRHQRKLKKQGRHSTLTDERERALNALETGGFTWDCHGATWNEKYEELCLFKTLHGHCNVPTTYPENRELSVWVKSQRRQYKLLVSGKKTSFNDRIRVSKLDGLGFQFNPRNLTIACKKQTSA